MNYITNPEIIEQRSMEIIASELGDRLVQIPVEMRPLIKRIIHTTADFEYADLVSYSTDFLTKLKESLLAKSPLIADTTMVLSGINKRVLEALGVEYYCYIKDPEVVKLAKEEGITRSMAAMQLTCQRWEHPILVVGNAPTALFKLAELMNRGEASPGCVLGVPVGFVGAAESKELLKRLNLPFFTIDGRKGGSTVAASILNAVLYELRGNITP